jgi:hypothetical protein
VKEKMDATDGFMIGVMCGAVLSTVYFAILDSDRAAKTQLTSGHGSSTE